MTLETNLNFSKAPRNQFVLEMLRPLRPPFLILSKFLSISTTYKGRVPFAVVFPGIIGFGSACFCFPLLKATLISMYG